MKDIPIRDKRVLVRVDFNVPLNDKREVTDTTRIERALPTIRYVLEHGGRPILMSHLGRPKGEKKEELSLKPCLAVLEKFLGIPVHLAPDCVGSEVEKLTRDLKPNEILLLENLRFHSGEEHPDKEPEFVKGLANLGDVYINDAFGTAHRAHASTTKVVPYFKGNATAGLLLEKEIAFLGKALLTPKRPFMAIIGGAKVSSKLGVLKALQKKADKIFIGGGMAYTFLKGQGVTIGNSLLEEELIPTTREILAAQGAEIVLPTDLVISDRITEDAKTQIISGDIPDGYEGLDVGPKTIASWKEQLQSAETIFWNGPVGVFELSPFANGTRAMAEILAGSPAITVVGGGDSIAAVNQMGVADQMSHISTGGGAALEYIEFGTLPGIEALNK